uniref:Zinc finger protein 771-like n=1 Tax=Xiphophorus maculatus TaxID=8083 RepID=A0A3B5QAH0_XIPMA
MSLSQSLRDFVRERLSAAAEEIFIQFDKTIVQYEEELDRQRRLLEICWKPQMNLHRIGMKPLQLQKSHGEQECFYTKGQQETQPPRVKDEQEEVFISVTKEQLEQKQEIDAIIVNPTYEEGDCWEPDPNSDQLFAHNQIQEMSENKNEDSGSSRNEELKLIKRRQKIRGHSDNVGYQTVKTQKKTHINNNLSPCKVCGRLFARNYLNQHIRTHTGEKPFSCLTCGKRFSERGNLTKHIRTHTGEKSFSCLVCGKSFVQQIHLTRHIRTHTGEKPFSCSTCGKSFSQSSSLSGHMRTHTGEKPFSCLTCGQSFSERGSLFHHSRIHTGEKPFSCRTCGKRFCQKSNLTVHMKIHRGELV